MSRYVTLKCCDRLAGTLSLILLGWFIVVVMCTRFSLKLSLNNSDSTSII